MNFRPSSSAPTQDRYRRAENRRHGFADSSAWRLRQLQVGDLVLAIGDPFGVGETATMGIVSATGRGGLGIEDYEDFIQTDAAINPGNSGGAMIDIHGELVGINTAILSHGSGGNQGIGFAIPVNMAQAGDGSDSGARQSGSRLSGNLHSGSDAGDREGIRLQADRRRPDRRRLAGHPAEREPD